MLTMQPTKPQLCNAISSEGASPIIRIPVAEEWMVKRALDQGAHGVLTPMCHSAVCTSISPLPLVQVIQITPTNHDD